MWAFLDNFVVRYFTNRPRRVAFVNSVLAFDRREDLKHIFPTLELTQIFPGMGSLDLKFESFEYQEGNVSFAELAMLAAIVRIVKPRSVFEFGTFNGNTTHQLALNAPPDCMLYTIDLPAGEKRTRLSLDRGDRDLLGSVAVGKRFTGSPAAGRIHQLLSDTATFDFAPFEGKIDLVVIDGAHSRDYIKHDTRQALRIRSAHGVLLWHDYMVWNDVTDYLNELCSQLELIHIKSSSLVIHRGEPAQARDQGGVK